MKTPQISKILIKFLATAIILVRCLQVYSQDKIQKKDAPANKYYELGQFNGPLPVAEDGKIVYNKGFTNLAKYITDF